MTKSYEIGEIIASDPAIESDIFFNSETVFFNDEKIFFNGEDLNEDSANNIIDLRGYKFDKDKSIFKFYDTKVKSITAKQDGVTFQTETNYPYFLLFITKLTIDEVLRFQKLHGQVVYFKPYKDYLGDSLECVVSIRKKKLYNMSFYDTIELELVGLSQNKIIYDTLG